MLGTHKNVQVSSEILGIFGWSAIHSLTCLPFVESPGQKTAKKPWLQGGRARGAVSKRVGQVGSRWLAFVCWPSVKIIRLLILYNIIWYYMYIIYILQYVYICVCVRVLSLLLFILIFLLFLIFTVLSLLHSVYIIYTCSNKYIMHM